MMTDNKKTEECFPPKQKKERARLYPKAYFGYIFLIIMILLLVTPVYAMRDPSAVYCSAQGYEYVIENTPEGDWGYCILPDGTKADSWLFLQGKTAISNNYCSKQGLKTKTVIDPGRCIQFMTDECTVCILANGTEIEVTELMGLSFNESICGDGTCGMPENNQTCPHDCPSGGMDEFCDGVADKICDPDCSPELDLDCKVEKLSPTSASLNVILVLGAIVVCGLWFIQRQRR